MVLRFGFCEKEIAYKLKYYPGVKKSDLPKIDVKNRDMSKKAIEDRLTTQPEIYGKPLRKTLKRILEVESQRLPYCFQSFQ